MLKQLNKENYIELSFLSVFAVLPFEEIFSLIAVILLLALVLLFKPKKGFLVHLKNNYLIGLLGVYFLLAVLSLLYTSEVTKSIDKVSKLTAFVIIPLAFLLANPNNSLIKKAKHVFAYSAIVFSIFSLGCLIYNYIVNYDISHWYNFVQASMYHKYMPEDAMYLNTALIIVLFGDYHKNLKLIASILFLSVIVLFGVRLGLFIYGLIVGVYFIINFKRLLNLRSIGVLVIGLILSLALISQSRYVNDKFYDTLEKIGIYDAGKVSEIGEEYHKIDLRQQLYVSAIDLIKEKPIIGHGAGVEKMELSEVFIKRNYDLPDYNAHSQVLSTWIQYGIIGVLILVTFFIVLGIKYAKQKNIINLLILMVMGISMTVESYLEIQQGVFYFCIFISLLALDKKET